MGHARRGLDQLGGGAKRGELAHPAVARRRECITLVLEVGDRRQRVEHASQTGAQLTSLTTRRRRGASGSLCLEVELLKLAGMGGRLSERIGGIAAALHELVRKLGFEALEDRAVAADRACGALQVVEPAACGVVAPPAFACMTKPGNRRGRIAL